MNCCNLSQLKGTIWEAPGVHDHPPVNEFQERMKEIAVKRERERVDNLYNYGLLIMV